jgi:hypothetical protein
MSDTDLFQALRGSFLKGLLIARTHIRNNAPIRSGDLRRATDFTQPEIQGTEIVSRLGIDNSLMKKKYGEFVVFGTGLYGPYKTPVRPLKAKALHFTIGSTEFFRRTVKGMKPNNYFKRGYDENRSEIGAAMGKAAGLLVLSEIHSARVKNETN